LTTEVTSSTELECDSDEAKELAKRHRQEMYARSLSVTNYFIKTMCKSYLGVPNDWLWVIDFLHTRTQIDPNHIKLSLMKIKLNDTFYRLGDQFGISHIQASSIFKNTIPHLSNMLKILIYFPDKLSIKRNVPISFRTNYSNVQ